MLEAEVTRVEGFRVVVVLEASAKLQVSKVALK
jgi:hypothetical protein